MKLKEIHRTSTFAWSPGPGNPWLATGTMAGALDASFSNESQLELWCPDFMDESSFDMGGESQAGAKATAVTSARFNRIAWGALDATRPKGVIAGGLENGEFTLWDPTKLIEKADDASIFTNNTHTGPVRGLDFNPIQANLLSSGAVNGEIYIWNLQEPSKPYSPGTRSSKLDEITSLAWNRQVPYVLATSGNTGYTVVWDLRGKREVVALAYTGTTVGQVGGGMSMGGRKGMSDVCWHPDNATRLVTSSEDDSSPVIMLWDLRNARAPEKVLSGHDKGVLSVSWCKQDADILLSGGKDNRSICWNPQTSEMIGELPIANNWAFQVQFSPSNPSLLASAAFDGTISIHNTQSTAAADAEALHSAAISPTQQPDGADIFDAPSSAFTSSQPSLSLEQAPKWLRVPIAASWGYGGKLVSVQNLPGAAGTTQSSVVHLRQVSTEKDLVERAEKLINAANADGEESLRGFVEERCKALSGKGGEEETWKALLSLFDADSRSELIGVLGFSKEEVADKVADAIASLNEKAKDSDDSTKDNGKPHEPVVSFVEPSSDTEDGPDTEVPEASAASLMTEGTPSEVSGGGSGGSEATTTKASTHITEPEASLFGEEPMGTPHTESAADFFSSMGTIRGPVPPHVLVPHTNPARDSSVAATMGSRSSSVASDVLSLRNVTFKMYPKEESIVDKLVTKSLVVGDFESAVSLCLTADRFADAILLAVRGGPELLQQTQKAYFERRTTALPYLRVYQSIVMNDLSDIVQNADLKEWQEIFVVLCTFAKADEFWNLAEQLGQRLEFQGSVIRGSDLDGEDKLKKALEYRKNATLCYLTASKLEKVVNIWLDEMKEEETALSSGVVEASAQVEEASAQGGSKYALHAQALQSFIEKVTVFRNATKYVDSDLQQAIASSSTSETSAARTYKLGALYDRYFEYADLLASQGLVAQAVEYVNLTPPDYKGGHGSNIEFDIARERLLAASGAKKSTKTTLAVPSTSRAPAAGYSYDSYAGVQQAAPAPASQPGYSSPYAPVAPASTASGPYGPTQGAYQGHPAQGSSYGPSGYGVPNGGPSASVYAPVGISAQPASAMVPLPPPPISSSGGPNSALQPPPPPRKVEKVGGWNDAPPARSPANAGGIAAKRSGGTGSPFPMSSSPAPLQGPFGQPIAPQSPQGSLPPPPRGGTPQSQLGGPPRPLSSQGQLPPPPGRGSSFRPPPGVGAPPLPPQQQQLPPPPRGPPPPQGAQQVQSGPGRQMAAPPANYPQQMQPPPVGAGAPQGQYPLARMVSPPQQQQPGGSFRPPAGMLASPPQAQAAMRSPSSQLPPPPQMRDPRGPVSQPPRNTPPPSAASGPYAPPPQRPAAAQPAAGEQYGPPPQGNAGLQGQAPPPPAVPAKAPSAAMKQGPPPPKYPPGDRSHIPNASKPIFEALSAELNQLRQTTPQKRIVDDTERRLNDLFDALNCEALSEPVIQQLLNLVGAMQRRNRDEALAIHMNLLRTGSLTDDIGMWMSGVKQLLIRL